MCKGKMGIGCERSRVKEHKNLISDQIKHSEAQSLRARAVQQSLQGQWTRWTNIIQRDLSWSTILHSSPSLLSFAFGVTYDTIATPRNLSKWGLEESGSCPLCDSPKCGVAHILSGCKVFI